MTLDGHLDVSVTDAAVEFTLTVRNTGAEPVELEFRSSKTADFAVDSAAEIWRWSDERMFAQAVRVETIAPDESVSQTASWENPPPGDYTVTATLAATDTALARRAEFTV